jgi:hypothetical protein
LEAERRGLAAAARNRRGDQQKSKHTHGDLLFQAKHVVLTTVETDRSRLLTRGSDGRGSLDRRPIETGIALRLGTFPVIIAANFSIW